MRLIVETRGDPVALMEADIDAAERAVTTGIREAGVELQRAWRGQITGAGLGERLARTIRLNVYPRAGQSIGAAALVFSRASELVDAFDRGVTIRSKHGFYLATPRRRRPVAGPRDGPSLQRVVNLRHGYCSDDAAADGGRAARGVSGWKGVAMTSSK